MRVDCNEDGFAKENVLAICSLGHSTKKVADRTKGFIGEKGIGFKSVFKVASSVHISSGPWSFRFDSIEPLGMIAPILESFPPEEIVPGQTQMILDLKGKAEAVEIDIDLENIPHQLLIFLRKLRKITIFKPLKRKRFMSQRIEHDGNTGGEIIDLSTGIGWNSVFVTSQKYIIVRDTQKDLPDEERRPGVKETEIVLAFPVEDDTTPVIKSQYTYAYLPIDDYGFKVSIVSATRRAH